MTKVQGFTAVILSILTLLSTFFAVTACVSATEAEKLASSADSGIKGSLTIRFRYHKDRGNYIAVPGAVFEIHRFATMHTEAGKATYKTIPCFKSLSIEYDKLTGGESESIAAKLVETVQRKKLKGISAASNSYGEARFRNLKHGMYLVREIAAKGKARTYSRIKPYLCSVPGIDMNGNVNSLNYNVVAEPKAEIMTRKKVSVAQTEPISRDRKQHKGVDTGDRNEILVLIVVLLSASLALFALLKKIKSEDNRKTK